MWAYTRLLINIFHRQTPRYTQRTWKLHDRVSQLPNFEPVFQQII